MLQFHGVAIWSPSTHLCLLPTPYSIAVILKIKLDIYLKREAIL